MAQIDLPSLPFPPPPSLPSPSSSIGGFSQGGCLAIFSALTYPKRLAGILGLSTYLPIHQILETVSLIIIGQQSFLFFVIRRCLTYTLLLPQN